MLVLVRVGGRTATVYTLQYSTVQSDSLTAPTLKPDAHMHGRCQQRSTYKHRRTHTYTHTGS